MDKASRLKIVGSDRFEKHIVQELERFGFKGFKREVSPFPRGEGGELLKIDIAFIEKKERLALELDGPSHFLMPLEEEKYKVKKKKQNRDGPTKAKTRIMKSLGWKVSRHSYLKNMKVEEKSVSEREKFWIEKLGKYKVKPEIEKK